MKPLKLAMTAFGPFHEKAEIDFTKLGENPFFIISGPTGAGKTTILDALCFALYGTASGADRKDADFRSRSADRATETRVALAFEVAGRRYHVERWPEQDVPKKRGNSGETTRKKHTAVLAEIDAGGRQLEGSIRSGLGEVREGVERILGLNDEQFRQVVLLPQGEFREFLLSGTRERTEILKKLFRSDRFEAVEATLKRRKGEIEVVLKEGRDRNAGSLKNAGVESIEALDAAIVVSSEKIGSLSAGETQARESAEKAAGRLQAGLRVEELFLRHERALAESRKVGDERPAAEANRERAAQGEKALRLVPLAEQVDACGKELAAKRKDLAIAESDSVGKRKEAASAKKALDSARVELQRKEPGLVKEQLELESLLPKLKELDAVRREEAAAEEMLARARADETAIKSKVGRAENRLVDLNARIPVLAMESAGREAIVQRLEAVREHGRAAAALEKLETELRKAVVATVSVGRALESAKADRDLKRKVSEALQRKALGAQAIVLAAALEAGAACPVCGSTEHPTPATGKAGELPTDAALDEAREAADTAEEHYEQRRVAMAQSEKQSVALQARVDEAKKGIGKTAEGAAAETPGQLEAELAALDDKARELEQFAKEKARIEPELAVDRAARESAAATLIASQRTATECETRRLRIEKELSGRSVAATVEERLSMVKAEIATLKERADALQAAFSKSENGATAAEASLEALRTVEAEISEKERGARDRFRKELLSEGFVDEALFREARMSREELAALGKELEAFGQRAAKAAGELEQAAKACAGQSRPDIASLTAEKEHAANAARVALQSITGEKERGKALSETKRQLDETLRKQAELEGRLSVVGRLATIASGENRKRITLQTYYLATLFDEVVRTASHRLDRMTRGRYRLRRTEEVGDARSRSGLELVVCDSWNDTERPVRTLSGGESFLASLALALGLSDAVLAQSGGRSLDAIFVDEGFGSLDADALDSALRTLQELQGDGAAPGRAVGIISHVEEVKKAVGKRIEVTRKAGEAVSGVQLHA